MVTDSRTPTDRETLGRIFVDAAWTEGDLERIDELCAPDIAVHDPTEPTAGTGPDAYKRYVSRVRDGISDLELTIEDVTVADGTVAIQVSGSGTPKDHFLGRDSADEDGETTFSGLEVIDIQDGSIMEWSGTLLDDAEQEAFVEGMHGDVIRPDDDEYDETRAVWNGMIDKYPALIAQCTGVADVIDAVNFAREHDLLVAVRGGGHNVAGTAVCDGGLVIDLSPMTGIHVNLDAQTVRAEAGATWAELDRETQIFGLATPALFR